MNMIIVLAPDKTKQDHIESSYNIPIILHQFCVTQKLKKTLWRV